MAVLSAQYKHPQSAYSQGLRNLIDSMLKTNPKERPDINQVRAFGLHYNRAHYSPLTNRSIIKVIQLTDRVLQSLA